MCLSYLVSFNWLFLYPRSLFSFRDRPHGDWFVANFGRDQRRARGGRRKKQRVVAEGGGISSLNQPPSKSPVFGRAGGPERGRDDSGEESRAAVPSSQSTVSCVRSCREFVKPRVVCCAPSSLSRYSPAAVVSVFNVLCAVYTLLSLAFIAIRPHLQPQR